MKKFQQQRRPQKTSWEKDSKWYGELTAGAGHYYHEHVVIPGVMRLLNLKDGSKLLDLGCGTGVLARQLKENRDYLGIDVSPGLIDEAKRFDKKPNHEYLVRDVTKPLAIPQDFTHAVLILSLQNMRDPVSAIKITADHLIQHGILIIVLNHPCFRIPRQSSWETDEKNKLQYRRINRYLSPLEIPITMHPSKHNSPVTWSYHLPLSAYTKMLRDSGFLIENIEEWTSDKKSEGSAHRQEDRARNEFPLFLAIKAVLK